MMKRFFLLCITHCALCLSAAADDYKYLTIYTADGTATDIELAQMGKITFTNQAMVIETNAGEQSFALSKLGKMVFASQPTPVEVVDAATAGQLKFLAGSIAVGPEAKGKTLSVYGQDGALIAQQRVGEKGASISLTSLPKGVYVVRIGNTAIKIAK